MRTYEVVVQVEADGEMEATRLAAMKLLSTIFSFADKFAEMLCSDKNYSINKIASFEVRPMPEPDDAE